MDREPNQNELRDIIASFDRDSVDLANRLGYSREEQLKQRAVTREELIRRLEQAIERDNRISFNQAVSVGYPGPAPPVGASELQRYGLQIETDQGRAINTQVSDMETAIMLMTTVLKDRQRQGQRSPVQVTFVPVSELLKVPFGGGVQGTSARIQDDNLYQVEQGPSEASALRTRAIDFAEDARQMPENSVAAISESERQYRSARNDEASSPYDAGLSGRLKR